jgi:hypothetical protein
LANGAEPRIGNRLSVLVDSKDDRAFGEADHFDYDFEATLKQLQTRPSQKRFSSVHHYLNEVTLERCSMA